MGKPTFTKLGLKRLNEIQSITINDQEIEIKQYLPIDDKLNIITNVLQNSADDNNFSNPVKVEVFFNLELIYAYTNITFTDKQKENPSKLYDLLEENSIVEQIINAIPDIEYKMLFDWTQETIESYYKYKSSALGIFEQISTDYSNLNLDATELQEKIADPNNLTLLKDVVEKLG